ncbi:peptide deformylase [symbiont of Argiope bruennichi]|uniref:peptide deformylase n=1 Tax=symbiont of Argiope bruennichi TaxID=2810479 RepID=UPI003DA29E9A
MIKIYKDTDPILRESSEDVALPLQEKDLKLFQKMRSFVLKTQKKNYQEGKIAVGISAVQLGKLKKIIYIKFSEHEEYGIINPKIIRHSTHKCYLGGGESCLSVDNDYFGFVPRYLFIEIKYFDIFSNKWVQKTFHEYQSIVIQHELDHLNGILYIDKLEKKIESEWHEI